MYVGGTPLRLLHVCRDTPLRLLHVCRDTPLRLLHVCRGYSTEVITCM